MEGGLGKDFWIDRSEFSAVWSVIFVFFFEGYVGIGHIRLQTASCPLHTML